MEDWAFGTAEQREKTKTLNILKGRQCKDCVSLTKEIKEIWCKKKTEEPAEGVCEWWEDLRLLQINMVLEV